MATKGTTTTEASPGLDHFIRLARKGKHPGASGGERRAARLARAVVDDLPGLDAKALGGLIEFIRGTAAAPWLAQDLIDG